VIAIVSVGRTFDGACRYVFAGSKDVQNAPALIAHTTMCGRDHRELAAEFIVHRGLHPALGRAVAHIVLRPVKGSRSRWRSGRTSSAGCWTGWATATRRA